MPVAQAPSPGLPVWRAPTTTIVVLLVVRRGPCELRAQPGRLVPRDYSCQCKLGLGHRDGFTSESHQTQLLYTQLLL